MIALVIGPAALWSGDATVTSQALRSVELDPEACYHVRELEFARGDVRYFLTEGILAFSKPVLGAPVAAVFSSAVDGGDGEVILLPPTKDERKMLSDRAGAPNIDEHLREAAFYFADDTAAELLKAINASEWCHRDPQQGAAMAQKYSGALRAVMPKFQTRLVVDLLNQAHGPNGFFASVLVGRSLGSFEVVYDRSAPEQILAGKVKTDNGVTAFDIWTSYSPRNVAATSAQTDFHADNYKIDAHIDEKLHMRITTTLEISGLHRAMRALPFDLSRQMEVTSAQVDGKPAELTDAEPVHSEFADSTDRVFAVIAADPIEPNSVHTVKVVHEGDVIARSLDDVFFVGSRGRWYPHHHLGFAKFDVIYHFPKDLDLVAPGDAVLDKVEGNERIIERRIDVPLPMAGFNLGHYDRTIAKRGQFTVEVCANRRPLARPEAPPSEEIGPRRPPGMRAMRQMEGIQTQEEDRVTTLAHDIGDVMEFYTRRLGPPPLTKLIVSPIPAPFGQGFGGILYLSTMAYMQPSGKLFADLDAQTRLFFTDLMHAHEVAHQWWGNLVTTSGYHDEWIMEALSNYCALLYLEKRRGAKAAETLLDSYRASLLDRNEIGEMVESAGPVTQGHRVELEGKPGAWVAVMYGKGTWIMRMLAARMGNERFWEMLAEIRKRYEYKSISTDQFREICAEFMPPGLPDKKLDAFFEQWVWGTGIPALKLTSKVSGRPPALEVSGTLAQANVPDDFSADFPVEIALRGKTLTKWVRSSSDPVPFNVSIATAPAEVTLDPRNEFLKR